MQDAIVTHLANAMDFQLTEAEAARLKRTPAANRDAEDLALQCDAGARNAGNIGKEADAAYGLCEQALAIDPNNVRALVVLGGKFWMRPALGVSGDPNGDLRRADDLESKALALDPDWTGPHRIRGSILRFQGRYPEAVAEHERALALDPSNVDAAAGLGFDYQLLGRFDKSLEYLDKAILASPYDPALPHFYGGKASANFGLKNYDEAIEQARQAIAIKPNYVAYIHVILVATLALTGHDAEAREALQLYLSTALHRAAQDDRGVEGALLQAGRRSTLRRDERADVRRPAQSRNAGGVSATRFGRRRPRCAAGRAQSAGLGADSGASRSNSVRPATKPSVDFAC
jgi:tetratricopeptide (TPR) repeat protein